MIDARDAQLINEVEQWQTTGVTPAPPGWLCIYRSRDKTSASVLPAVALLTQESTETQFVYRTADGKQIFSRTEEHDRDERVVFAVANYELGYLEPWDRWHRDPIGVCTEADFAGDEWKDIRELVPETP